jgi:hypothetical protein
LERTEEAAAAEEISFSFGREEGAEGAKGAEGVEGTVGGTEASNAAGVDSPGVALAFFEGGSINPSSMQHMGW